jgi:hypothetical protein
MLNRLKLVFIDIINVIFIEGSTYLHEYNPDRLLEIPPTLFSLFVSLVYCG